jgi:hypothetical protein
MAVSGQLNALIISASQLSLSEDQWAPDHVHAINYIMSNCRMAVNDELTLELPVNGSEWSAARSFHLIPWENKTG